MAVLVLDHPYPLGTRVRHAGDDSVGALATGSARVVEPVGQPGGDLDYRVRTDSGGEDTWPAYFTIPVRDSSVGRHTVYPTVPQQGSQTGPQVGPQVAPEPQEAATAEAEADVTEAEAEPETEVATAAG